MVDAVRANLDFSGMFASLDRLAGPARVSLARSMGVAGGTVLRDEAAARAPVKDGTLRRAIYLAYRDSSTPTLVRYGISWNASEAPHGHLLEFGHWQPYPVIKLADGTYVTDKRHPFSTPKWVAAHPFLRPAFDAAIQTAVDAMIKRGRERLPELLRGGTYEP